MPKKENERQMHSVAKEIGRAGYEFKHTASGILNTHADEMRVLVSTRNGDIAYAFCTTLVGMLFLLILIHSIPMSLCLTVYGLA